MPLFLQGQDECTVYDSNGNPVLDGGGNPVTYDAIPASVQPCDCSIETCINTPYVVNDLLQSQEDAVNAYANPIILAHDECNPYRPGECIDISSLNLSVESPGVSYTFCYQLQIGANDFNDYYAFDVLAGIVDADDNSSCVDNSKISLGVFPLNTCGTSDSIQADPIITTEGWDMYNLDLDNSNGGNGHDANICVTVEPSSADCCGDLEAICIYMYQHCIPEADAGPDLFICEPELNDAVIGGDAIIGESLAQGCFGWLYEWTMPDGSPLGFTPASGSASGVIDASNNGQITIAQADLPAVSSSITYKVTITHPDPSMSAFITEDEVTISVYPQSITDLPNSPTCISDGNFTLTNEAGLTGAWTSSNTGVATINPTSGLVNPVGEGITSIEFTDTYGCIITENITLIECCSNPVQFIND